MRPSRGNSSHASEVCYENGFRKSARFGGRRTTPTATTAGSKEHCEKQQNT
jgi:hypothetical protein